MRGKIAFATITGFYLLINGCAAPNQQTYDNSLSQVEADSNSNTGPQIIQKENEVQHDDISDKVSEQKAQYDQRSSILPEDGLNLYNAIISHKNKGYVVKNSPLMSKGILELDIKINFNNYNVTFQRFTTWVSRNQVDKKEPSSILINADMVNDGKYCNSILNYYDHSTIFDGECASVFKRHTPYLIRKLTGTSK